ncbi:MobF family relaxase, partial [Geodermatophilus nigrescens]
MSLHKLTAGDGYTYLTRQVAAMDATERGHSTLGDYYSQRAESPGRWAGAGLAGLEGPVAGQPVDEAQMTSLFGAGRHPDAESLERAARATGASERDARRAGALGQAFSVFTATTAGFRERCAEAFVADNRARGQPPHTPLPLERRARIRSDLARALFTEAHSRGPHDARELSGFIARASRPATRAVAGYDLTFSPVKSVSALWALAPRDVAETIEAAHAAAVADVLAWLEHSACYTRTGHDGVRQVDTTGLMAAVFTHRDSRAGDPDLHTHVAVSNKVQGRDGRWRALDGRVLHKAAVAASERYNTRLEARLTAGLGVRFTPRAGAAEKRPVREIRGLDPRLLDTWSSRRHAIDARRGELSVAFQHDHGRPPTAVEAIALAQRATLETREAKHEPRSLAEQRATWRRQALDVLGGPAAVVDMLDDVLRPRSAAAPPLTTAWVRSAAARVLDTVAGQRATWQVWHVRAEAERVVRAADLAPADVDTAVARVAEHALSPDLSLPLGEPDPVVEPAELRRDDGASVYTVAGDRLHTSRAVLAAEAVLLAAAGRTDGRRADPDVVELALRETAAGATHLNPGQRQLVRALAGSGARVQLALAPAGTGKTTALAALARAWTADGGTVLGLAPSAVATAGLRAATGAPSDTLSKLVCSLDAGDLPAWAAHIGPGTLVVVDEAGMAGTRDLARAVDHVLGRGGSVRLIGDAQQLAAVAAGGVLAEIAAAHGAVTLTQLVRFADPAEAAATVALRDGDPLALGFYLDAGRVHVGDGTTCAEQAYTAWAADRARGADALLLAATREAVQRLNARARADRLASAGGPPGREVALADGTRAGAGDPVITRANDRRLPLGAADWVKNGDRWTVIAVGEDGALAVAHTGTGRRITLPAAYVRASVQLGYAATVHGAQGVTADSCHTVLTGTESRQLLYVALTRGRTANHLYLTTVGDGDPHGIVTPAAVSPPTAADLLAAVLGRDGA